MATTTALNLLSSPSSSSLKTPLFPKTPFSHKTPTLSFYSHSYPSLSISHKPRSSSFTISAAVKSLTETESVTISQNIPSVSGVYAVYDNNDELQFIGLSRNISATLLSHLKTVPDKCAYVKVGVVDEPDRASMTEAWKSWMEEHIKATGKVPSGNETGNATWVRQPPKKKADLRLTPGRHMQLTVPLEELIDRLVKENKVVAFIKGTRSTPLCGFSQKVVGILESHGVDYETVDVLDEEYNYGLRDTLKRYSNWPTFPQIFVNGELVGGCDIVTSMHENGELGSLFKQSK